MAQRPIAVCMIVENLPVPFVRKAWQEAVALRDAGYSVSVISIKGPGCESSRETIDGIEIYRHAVWEASGPFGYLIEYSWALLAQFFLASKAYARARFRIIHAWNPPDTMFVIARFFKLFGVKFIFEHMDLCPELYQAKFRRTDFFYRLVRLAERLSYRTATVAIVPNQSYREVAIERGRTPPDRIFTVRVTPEPEKMRRSAVQPELKQGKKFLVVYLGVMGPQDGLDLLLESVEVVVKERARQDTQFTLIGSGTELPRLKARVRQKGLESCVSFTGRIPGDALARYLSTADVGVAPDPLNPMNDKSTMGKILEYMAFEVPVVLYDLTEGRRAAAETALYARPNDPKDFAEKISMLLESEDLRRRLGQRGRQRIEESLNWNQDKQALLAAYAAALRPSASH